MNEHRNKYAGQAETHRSVKPKDRFLCSETELTDFTRSVETFQSRKGMALNKAFSGFPERSNGTTRLLRSAKQTTVSEVNQMQRTITEQVAPTAGRSEPEFLQLIRRDPRIRSVVTVRIANPRKLKETHGLVKTSRIRLPTQNTDSFLVTDLLEDITYAVGQEGAFSKLVFALKHEQVMVAVQPGSDLTEIAHDFATHLATVTADN